MKNFFIIILVFILKISNAQDECTCELYTKSYSVAFARNINMGVMDSAKWYANNLIRNQSDCCKAVGYLLLANTYFRENNSDSLKHSIVLAKKFLSDNYEPFASHEVFRMEGHFLFSQGKIDSAMDSYIKGLELAESKNSNLFIQKACTDLAYVFNSINDPQKALVYQKRALASSININEIKTIAVGYSNLAATYGVLLEVTGNKIYNDSIFEASQKCLHYAKLDNNKISILQAYNLLAGYYLGMNEFKTAVLYSDSVLTQTTPGQLNNLRVAAFYKSGQGNLQLKNIPLALSHLDSALVLSRVLSNIGIEQLVLQQLYYVNKELGNSEKALFYFESYKTLNDSIMNIDKTARINELEEKYNRTKNEQTIQDLNQEKEISLFRIRFLIAGIIAALLFALVLFFYYRQKHFKQKQTILETEQRLNRARMNPHFFFNALASLQNLALQENDGKILASNLSKFSHIMRETLESTYKEYVTIEQEIDFLSEYLSLQKMRFPQKFNYSIEPNENIDLIGTVIPSMIIQPFVENSIEHGFIDIEYIGNIIIKFAQENDDIVIEIIDNGRGLNANYKENVEHISRASQIIKDRIYLLNIKLKTKAHFSIENKLIAPGVIVRIILPVISQNENFNY